MPSKKGRKAVSTSFKPGQSGNPAGRKKLPPEVKEARKLSQESMVIALNKLIYCNREDLKSIIADPTTDALTLLVASIVSKGISGGDHMRLGFIFDRLIGKVSENVKLSASEEGFKIIVQDYTSK